MTPTSICIPQTVAKPILGLLVTPQHLISWSLIVHDSLPWVKLICICVAPRVKLICICIAWFYVLLCFMRPFLIDAIVEVRSSSCCSSGFAQFSYASWSLTTPMWCVPWFNYGLQPIRNIADDLGHIMYSATTAQLTMDFSILPIDDGVVDSPPDEGKRPRPISSTSPLKSRTRTSSPQIHSGNENFTQRKLYNDFDCGRPSPEVRLLEVFLFLLCNKLCR